MVRNPYIILQARMNSERLPGKVMRPINGIPLIGILIERLKKSGYPIILATSKNKENNVLCDYAEKTGILVFRGSEENVLERYYLAASKYKVEYIIRITGDNPLIDGFFIKKTIEGLHKFNKRSYFSIGRSKTFPVGMGFEFFSFDLLEEAFKNVTNSKEKEHVTPYLHQNMPGDIDIQTIKNAENKSHYRLTVDTEKDFELIRVLIEENNACQLTMNRLIAILDNNSDLRKINEDVKQKSWTSK